MSTKNKADKTLLLYVWNTSNEKGSTSLAEKLKENAHKIGILTKICEKRKHPLQSVSVKLLTDVEEVGADKTRGILPRPSPASSEIALRQQELIAEGVDPHRRQNIPSLP
ncbi:hypothetical protein LOAG_04381 [Loa loa]|uniref:Uncharacterized protein n=1 Tax=Loa loa TaxID=7209 RepID=A0A1S0U2H9_LOALO|nr:hypothetical protein LOAG_04381 [Loa loa]EFO24104.1 hypothetical protein LOAG_04381 [Loa loa]